MMAFLSVSVNVAEGPVVAVTANDGTGTAEIGSFDLSSISKNLIFGLL